MAKRAKTHRAKEYRFIMLSNTDIQKTNSNRKSYSASTRENVKKSDMYKYQNIERSYLKELREMNSEAVSKFKDLQIRILKDILNSGVEKCAAKISSKEVKENLQCLEREFIVKSCPGCRNSKLF